RRRDFSRRATAGSYGRAARRRRGAPRARQPSRVGRFAGCGAALAARAPGAAPRRSRPALRAPARAGPRRAQPRTARARTCGGRPPLVVAFQDREVQLADRLVDQAALIFVVERAARHLLGRDQAELGDLGPDRVERAAGLGIDLALRVIEPTLPVGLCLLLYTSQLRFALVPRGRADVLRLVACLADQLAVLLEQLSRFRAGLVCLVERAADPLAPVVDQLLNRAERVLPEHEEGDQEADDRPDHQPRRDLDQGVR